MALTQPEDSYSWLIREGLPEDLPFIYSTWLKWYAKNSPIAKKISSRWFYQCHHRLIESLFQSNTTQIHCAVFPETPEVIAGYLVSSIAPWKNIAAQLRKDWPGVDAEVEKFGDNPVLHFAWVNMPYKLQGNFTHLCKAAGVDWSKPVPFTSFTYDTMALLQKFPKLEFIPYLM